MKRSKQWLIEANKLCSKLDSEDGIDPRILARKRVPALKFQVVAVSDEVNDHAY